MDADSQEQENTATPVGTTFDVRSATIGSLSDRNTNNA